MAIMSGKFGKYGVIILLSVIVGFLLAFFVFRYESIKRALGLSSIPYEKINSTSQEHKDLIRPAIFNIEDFGASLESDDNSNALQAAIDAAIVTSTELRTDDKWDIYVGKVYIPAGHWRFERGISSDIGVEIIGDGVGKTYLDFTGSGTFMDFGSENEKFDLKIKDLFINQFHSEATAIHLNQVNRNSGISNIIIEGGGIGLSLLNCYTPSFDSFFIYNASKFGILGRNATNTDFRNFKVENCKVGAKFTNSDINSSTGLKFFGGVIQGCYDEGLILEDLTNFTSFSTFLEGNGRNEDKPQIKITSDLNEKFDNDIIAFYSPFITGGHSAHKDQNAVEVENTYTFIFNESFIRANDRILTGIKVGKNVINAEILNSKYSGVKQNFIVEDPATNLVLDPKLREGRGYGRQFLGLGSESGKANNRHYMESYQGIFGNLKEGKIGIGTFNGKPSIQGFGNGSSYSMTTNPKIGDHISAPNGITEISGIKFGTTITSSNVKTDKKSRNIIVNTNDGKRLVAISPSEEEIRRELLIKNSGTTGNLLEINSSTSNIENKKILNLKDGEAVNLLYDGTQWQIISKYTPTGN